MTGADGSSATSKYGATPPPSLPLPHFPPLKEMQMEGR